MQSDQKYFFSSKFKDLYLREFMYLCDHLLEGNDKTTSKEYGDKYLNFEPQGHDSVAEMFAKYCVYFYLPERKLVPHYMAEVFGEIRRVVGEAIPMNQRKGIDVDSIEDETIGNLRDKIQKLIKTHCDPE